MFTNFLPWISCSMASILPALIVRVEDQTTATFILTYGTMIVIMVASQFCWTEMALLTPPGESIFADNSAKVDKSTLGDHQLVQNIEDEDAP